MGLFDRVSRVLKANLNDMSSASRDPVQVLESCLLEMQEDLVQLRQAVASAIASQRRTEQQYTSAQTESNTWQQRAQLVLQKGDENLAREALLRKKTHQETATSLKTQLDQQVTQIDALKRNLMALESKISEAKTLKSKISEAKKARLSAAKASEQIASMTGKINTSGATAAFERMEEKVLQMEAQSQGVMELGDPFNFDVELEDPSNIDAELKRIKEELLGLTVTKPRNSELLEINENEDHKRVLGGVEHLEQKLLKIAELSQEAFQELADLKTQLQKQHNLKSGSQSSSIPFGMHSVVDAELEALKKQIDDLPS
jgi:phage shock protein A